VASPARLVVRLASPRVLLQASEIAVALSAAESDLLLGHLTSWVQQHCFTLRFRWSAGTIAMCDNRCTQHRVLNDFLGERMIPRVTVMGDSPEPAVPLPRWEPHGSKTAVSWRDADMRWQLKAQRTQST